METVKEVKAREILDSRGNPTVEATVKTENYTASASCPSGASTGRYEAVEIRDGGARYDGMGVRRAVYNVNNVIGKLLKGHEVNPMVFDSIMVDLDGTENKERLGANAILPVSMASYRLKALIQGKGLFSVLGKKKIIPVPYMNLINGGKHAVNNLTFQEYMIVPKDRNFEDSLRIGTETYHYLGKIIKEKYNYNQGDEGGYAPNFKNLYEGFEVLAMSIEELGYSKKIKLALDAAANSFYLKGKYKADGKLITPDRLLDIYFDITKKYKLVSIEDPFNENDFDHFYELNKKIDVVGDDLTVTNKEKIIKAINHKSVNCVLVKMNQIGTVTETLDAANFAMRKKLKVIVSHRSGETSDSFIADLAVGLGCGSIKAGAPSRSERLAKYNRLLEIKGRRFG